MSKSTTSARKSNKNVAVITTIVESTPIIKKELHKMNADLNFTLDFGTNRLDIIFNNAADAKMYTVTDSWDAKHFGNMLTHLMNVAQPHYQIMESGMMLHRSLEEASISFSDKNVGYVLGTVLLSMVNEMRVVYSKEIKPTSTYKIFFDGIDFKAAELPFTEWSAGEPAFVGQNRNANHLVRTITKLFRAQAMGMNIRLLFTEKTNGYLNLKKTQYELFVDGKFDELAALIQGDNEEKATYNTLRRYEAIAERVIENGETFVANQGTFEIRDFDNKVIAKEELIGRTIQFVSGQIVLNKMYAVTEQNLDAVVLTIKNQKRRVLFVDTGVNTLKHI
jgi:hypothetical protein